MEVKWLAVTAIAPIAWGSTYFATREYLPDAPLWGAVLRALPAGLLLLAVRPRRPRGNWWWRSLVLGSLTTGAFFALVYVAAQRLPTSVASTVMALSPLVLLLLARLILGARPAVAALGGAALALVGVVLLVGRTTEPVDPLGLLASAAALCLSSVGFLLAQRWSADVDLLASTSWQLLAGALLLLPVAVLVEGGPPPIDAPTAVAYAYVAVIATAVAFTAWFAGLRHLDAGTVGLIGLLNPVTGVALGTALASEQLEGRQWLGLALILAGVLAGLPRPRPQAATSARSASRTPA
jgi:probable blue pigment (indigoidine) exporter